MTSSTPTPSGYVHEDAFDSGFLPVGDIHKVWYAQYGAPNGRPVMFLHGGPGGGTKVANTCFFDPKVYRVVLMDQRGAGKSAPVAEIRDNTTHHLIEDIEQLRKHLGIEKWAMVFGGSWGSSLALAYAQTHPQMTGALVLRGIFTVRKSELVNNYAPYGVISQVFPEEYDELMNHLRSQSTMDSQSLNDPATMLSEYYRLLCHEDPRIHKAAALVWNKYETTASTLARDPGLVRKIVRAENWSIQQARIECHYFVHQAWLEDGILLKPTSLERIKDIPCEIVQGRYDMVCPARTAWELHKGLKNSTLHMIPDAGHSANEHGIKAKLIEICDSMARM
ncbi:uncharacterized protein J7T54_000991 [Emericellopsis cladophorae]|uniref:Proline iminopeptidase n=1 Tax=Emericellopsis cladophorae TaxID=2686198 RepID=A0A9P9XWR6_9HYPO|nr:uncharacterized protein J7T54_000991 [Emericellopsis cladophorae]KAI6779261.1 hypothetical protein J7T54_000991 [Emericellopsis cladophorae]